MLWKKVMNNLSSDPIVWENFSPTILEFELPEKFTSLVNLAGDAVLGDESLSKKFDFSENLVGKVSKEIKIPAYDKEETKYLSDTIKEGCLGYLKHMEVVNRAYGWSKISKGKQPTIDNIHLAQSWIVSQYKHEYNPWHTHSGNFSGVIYLKIPKDMHKENDKEFKDHYPATGLIEFMYGEKSDFRSDNLKFVPKVGMMLIFPSWLKHTVYPFYSDGERRSMSFNAHYKL
jgi:hypothetical protein|tara:strand:- start:127 stop:816 length:690 start_codon:yes stop_codon:yes gene_type:complete